MCARGGGGEGRRACAVFVFQHSHLCQSALEHPHSPPHLGACTHSHTCTETNSTLQNPLKAFDPAEMWNSPFSLTAPLSLSHTHCLSFSEVGLKHIRAVPDCGISPPFPFKKKKTLTDPESVVHVWLCIGAAQCYRWRVCDSCLLYRQHSRLQTGPSGSVWECRVHHRFTDGPPEGFILHPTPTSHRLHLAQIRAPDVHATCHGKDDESERGVT